MPGVPYNRSISDLDAGELKRLRLAIAQQDTSLLKLAKRFRLVPCHVREFNKAEKIREHARANEFYITNVFKHK